MLEVKRFDSSEGNVFKYVFTDDDYVAEAVLYRYEDFYKRTVIRFSTQSGCPVGCTFCGTGKKFVRNLTSDEIVTQIRHILTDMSIEDIDENGERFQIMFMSMGEPFLNYEQVEKAIRILNCHYTDAELLISTIGPNQPKAFAKFIELSKRIDKIGLQFSIQSLTTLKEMSSFPIRTSITLNRLETTAFCGGKKPDVILI